MNVGAPGGVDDTARLQAALDRCVALGGPCTVQLGAGTYRTRQLVSYGFHGTFRGAGRSRTVVEALPDLPVFQQDPMVEGACLPDTTDCPWPSLVIFVDGQVTLSDLSFQVPSVPATTGWAWGTALQDIVRVMAHERASLTVERVVFEGRVDPDPSGAGYNTLNGVILAGELPRSRTPLDYHTMSGSLTVRACSFRHMYDGPGMSGFVQDGAIVIGGSARGANTYQDLFVPILMNAVENSVVDVSHNLVQGTGFYGILLVPWVPEFVVSRPSLYFLHDNVIAQGVEGARGIELWDDPANPTMKALVFDNVVGAPGEQVRFGVNLIQTRGVLVQGNRIAGAGAAAVVVQDSVRAAVLGNDVAGFSPVYQEEFGRVLGDVVLDETTTESLVVCRSPSDSVLDLGTGNRVVRCR